MPAHLTWPDIVALCKKNFSCLLIPMYLSLSIPLVYNSLSHSKVIHTPVICHLQRLALDVIYYDYHWCFCMQIDQYAGFKDMSRLLCQVVCITIPI